MNTRRLILGILGVTAFSFAGNSQCNVTITPSATTVPCGGGMITLTANGTGYSTTPLNNDFNAGNAGPGWTVSAAGTFNNPCDPSYDGGSYMWMGNTTAAPRTMETAPLDLSCGGTVCFYLDMATQGGTGACEGPDLTNEGVFFEYSIDGGATWVTINYFQPNAGGTAGAITQWNQYCYPIPAAAQTTNTLLHWFQNGSSGNCCDHWGIDDVVVTATGCNPVWYDWAHIPGTTGPAGDNAVQNVMVTNDTTFTVCYTDGAGFQCCETIAITVNGMGAPTIATLDETCDGFDDGEVTITPNGGVGGYTFNITAGPGAPYTNTTGNFTGLPDGNYTVDVVDNGSACTVTANFTIGQGVVCCPGPINLQEVHADLLCFQNNMGSITVTPSGGSGGPYMFELNASGTPLANNIFTGLPAGNHTIDVTDNLGCTATVTVLLTEPPVLNVVPGTSDATCFGSCDGQIFLAPSGGTAGYTFNWVQGIAAANSAQASNVCAGTYDVTVTDANNCTFNVNGIVINEPPAMTIQSTASADETCQNACDGTITVVEPTAVSFTVDNGVNAPVTQANGNFTGLCAGTYTITVTNAAGCTATGTETVGSPNPIVLSVSNDTLICENGTAIISASSTGGQGVVTYTWDNGLGMGASHTVNPVGTTIYNVVASDINGCATNPMPIIVNLNPALSVTALTSQAICPGQFAGINALANGGDGNYTYSWFDGVNTLNGGPQSVSPAVTTNYTVTVTDGCESTAATDMLTITVNPTPNVLFSADRLDGCMPVMTTFSNDTDPLLSGGCLWDFGDGNLSTDCNPTHTYPDPGCYDVTLTVTSPDGCVGDATQTSMICVYDIPVADFDLGPQPTDLSDPVIDFTNMSSGADSYVWEFGYENQVSNDVNPTHTFPFVGPAEYDVCLQAWNDEGCSDTICKPVVIDNVLLLYVPNAFTPDGDGINDVFKAEVSGIAANGFTMYIFDRWGHIIFQSNSPDVGWDGSIKGVMADSETEVYVWKIILKLEESLGAGTKDYIGHVTLLK